MPGKTDPKGSTFQHILVKLVDLQIKDIWGAGQKDQEIYREKYQKKRRHSL